MEENVLTNMWLLRAWYSFRALHEAHISFPHIIHFIKLPPNMVSRGKPLRYFSEVSSDGEGGLIQQQDLCLPNTAVDRLSSRTFHQAPKNSWKTSRTNLYIDACYTHAHTDINSRVSHGQWCLHLHFVGVFLQYVYIYISMHKAPSEDRSGRLCSTVVA